MSDNRDNLTPERRERIRHRRRVLLWVLGGTVLLLLAIIVSQQLWLFGRGPRVGCIEIQDSFECYVAPI